MLNPSKKIFTSVRLALLLSAVMICGCYPDWPDQAGTAIVHGNLSLDGSPVSQANIVFVPNDLRNADDKLMPLAYGTTDADGKFELAYSDGNNELLAGSYTVMVTKVKQVDEDHGQEIEPWRNVLLPESVANLTVFSDTGETIPSIYNRKSILNYEVIASPNIIRPKFELTSVDPALKQIQDSE